MAALVTSSNKRLKTGLPPPCVYNDLYSSYRVEWEARKRKFTPSMEVSSLCHYHHHHHESTEDDGSSSSPDLLLVGMTNGSLSIFRQYGQQSQSEEEVLDQQVSRGDTNNNDDQDDVRNQAADDYKESFGWRLVGTHQLGEGALTFLHVSSLSAKKKQSVVLVGSVDGLWWWNSVEDLLKFVKSPTTTVSETKGHKSASRSENQPVNHTNDISIVKAEANDSELFFSTPEHKLYHVSIPSLIGTTYSSKKTLKTDWLQEMPMPDNDTISDDDDGFEVTTLHLTAAAARYKDTVSTDDDDDDSPAPSTLLLIGTNQSKVHCWDVRKEAFSEPLDLNSVKEEKRASTSSRSAFGGDSSSEAGQEEEEASIRVTAITSIQPDWWTISGTIVSSSSAETFSSRATGGFRKRRHPTKISRPAVKNFLGTWHGPSKSRTQLVSNIPERIQGLMVMPPPHLSNSKLYSIGNLPVLTVWESPYQLDRIHQIKTNAKSNNAICCMQHADILAVAGVGPKVDLVQSTVRLQSLDLLQSTNTVKTDVKEGGAGEIKK